MKTVFVIKFYNMICVFIYIYIWVQFFSFFLRITSLLELNLQYLRIIKLSNLFLISTIVIYVIWIKYFDFFFNYYQNTAWRVNYKFRAVWDCGSGCDSKYFLLKNILKWYFFKKNIFEISISKRSENIKKYIFSKFFFLKF